LNALDPALSRAAVRLAFVVAGRLEAHGFEFRSHELCGNFMSACPSPATLKQVVRREPHVCAKSFRPDGSRGFVGSILTGKNYARSPNMAKTIRAPIQRARRFSA
jgi:hypothetical protein